MSQKNHKKIRLFDLKAFEEKSSGDNLRALSETAGQKQHRKRVLSGLTATVLEDH